MESSTDLKQYFALFVRWLWLIALATVLAAAAAYGISKQIQPTYQSTTRILINQAPASQQTDYTSILTSERLAQTYAQMITAQPILDEVIQNLNLGLTPTKLKEATTVQLVRDTQLIDVSITNQDPNLAASIANEMVNVFVRQTQAMEASRYSSSKQNLEKQLADLDQKIKENNASLAALPTGPSTERDKLEAYQAQYQQTYTNLLQSYEQVRVAEAQTTSNLVQVQKAQPSQIPVSPKVLQNTLLAGVVGLMLAVGGVFLIEYLDDTVKNPEDITRGLGVPVIGYIAEIPEMTEKVDGDARPRSPVSEAFRVLRPNLGFARAAQPIKTILVTSPGPSEGKSTIAANLATIITQGGKKVILLDADLRRPATHKLVKTTNRLGLSDIFLGKPIQEVLQTYGTTSQLQVITSGSIPPNPAELLSSERMVQLLDELKEMADVVIIDSPPFVVSDASVLASRVDGVLMVIQPGVTFKDATASMVEQLKRANARVLGAVFNRIPRNRGYYYGGYRYYSPYQSGYETYFSPNGHHESHAKKRTIFSNLSRRSGHHERHDTPETNDR